MLCFRILVFAVPLTAVVIFAGVEAFPREQPCIAIGGETLEIASAPWHADLHVSFTDDPALATVRVAVTDDAETADFAVVDDVADSSDTSCATTPATQWVTVSASPSAASPVIYLSQEGPADYRVFVKSKR